MTIVGWHASHEQIAPSELLRVVALAEEAGFDAAMSSDHFSPWGERQGESGFAWSWLGAAMATTSLPFGVVNAPGQRYHPAIIAQAAATLAEMFPGRFWVALGTGEASNEHITGDRWPAKPARNVRLLECAEVIRALLRGEEVSADGLITVDRARLWTTPPAVPLLYCAALSTETARWCGEWADGLLTVGQDPSKLRAVVEAFREGGGDGKPVAVQVKVACGSTDEEALAAAHEQWRTNVLEADLSEDLCTPQAYEALGERVAPEKVAEAVHVSADPARHVQWLREYASLGFDALYLHNVNRWQREFVEVFGREVLPAMR